MTAPRGFYRQIAESFLLQQTKLDNRTAARNEQRSKSRTNSPDTSADARPAEHSMRERRTVCVRTNIACAALTIIVAHSPSHGSKT
ncbi:hypothetical protein [Bradyrhizobium sp. 33ap4]|uniref:hypothetical protein n=1 Tax=Bradyrhizobium sp. 33ap4 TaxID=3061630 RepID=UPI00293198B8|nr:hypothetical protein [Bradyrhizobium sp. 33ap4]